MNLEQIKNCSKEMLSPNDIAEVLCADAYSISLQVKEDKEMGKNSFPFPTIRMGTRTKIPRRPFLKAMGVEDDG